MINSKDREALKLYRQNLVSMIDNGYVDEVNEFEALFPDNLYQTGHELTDREIERIAGEIDLINCILRQPPARPKKYKKKSAA